MNIGISGIILTRNRRGFERYLRDLVVHLAKLKDDSHIYLYTDRPITEFSSYDKITVRVIPKRLKTFFWRNIFLPVHVIRDKIDIFHFPDNSVWFFPWKPTVVTLHDISPLLCRKQKIVSWWMVPIIKLIYFFIIRVARVIVTDSDSSKNDIDRYFGLGEGKVACIPLSHEHFFAPPTAEESLQIENDSTGESRVLFVGALDKRKNVVKLIEAVAIVRKRWKKNVRLIIVGEVKKSSGFRYTSRKELFYNNETKDFVTVAGYVNLHTLKELYCSATVYVLPSFYEGFGITVLEAMSCGTPVIVSESSWGHEITGDNALFIDPANEVDIAEKIIRILNNPELAAQMRVSGLAHAASYSWAATAEKTLTLYKKVLKK